ncbi:subtilase family protein [Anseongella ginsenosidimutans]|uniref:Subtilase family protein n=1 Tax=Anseongella ginsenosidimutans TaxID=496056 RepID=A0A4R3KQ61_9SPHI|nr:S8 family peptidase [Anseongella ginsenosidimutans]QEC53988.1 S8 family serine peptidase [Anseongella ginsenosidimutans]TCS86375.1 subtilase family protein [Anseongella ginsenosidimutans]
MKRNFKWVFTLTAACAFSAVAAAQELPEKKAPENWFNLDPEADNVPGVSTEKAYTELLANMEPDTVIVAVIDGGVEVDHEDLLGRIWVNPEERKGNEKDDDKNGYTDDIYGWDFIGGKNGTDVNQDNLEVTRLVREMAPTYEGADTSNFNAEQKAAYRKYVSMKEIVNTELSEAKDGFENYNSFYQVLEAFAEKIGKEEITREDLQNYQPVGEYDETVKSVVLQNLDETGLSFKDFMANVKEGVEYFGGKVKYHYNVDFDPRYIVQDNYNDPRQRYYGNNEVEGPDARHGTHVAGIIAASRTNNKGIKGVAGPVKIMAIRTVPDGDERDKDVANAIRYAAENGAKVINMSFGKAYSPEKEVVDEAVKFALSKDVLLVHAAGNDGSNVDAKPNYPSPYFQDSSEKAGAWIEVGASTWMGGEKLAAEFSNYGAERVDLFAPGYRIRSTVPGSSYEELDGTSMASPVVAGVAALVRAYYPELSAVQVKQALVSSVTPVDWEVIKPGTENELVKMTDLCISGGIVNAYKALQTAGQMAAQAPAEEVEKEAPKKKGGIGEFFRRLFGKKE